MSAYSENKNSNVYDVALFEDHLIMSNNSGIYESTGNGKSWSFVYQATDMVFYDFKIMDNMLIGGTKKWVPKDGC